jgi:anti-repressor protein
MESGLREFGFEGKRVRVVLIEDKPWWVVKDVCDILELSDVSMAVSRLDDDEKLVQKLFVSGQNRDMITINESGLYTLILRSNKPEARRFRKWVTSEVLPAINRTGVYITEQFKEFFGDPDTIIQIAQNWQKDRQKVLALEAKVEADHPKILFADSVAASQSDILVGQMAKLLRQNGIPIGATRFFGYLREEDYPMSTG